MYDTCRGFDRTNRLWKNDDAECRLPLWARNIPPRDYWKIRNDVNNER